jgi:hypothetical protein
MTNEVRMPIVRSPREWPIFVWIIIIAGIFVVWTAWQSAGANRDIREKQAEIDLWTEKIGEIIDQKKRDDANLLAENEALAIAKDREAQFRAQERTRRIQAEQENRRLRTARDEAVVESIESIAAIDSTADTELALANRERLLALFPHRDQISVKLFGVDHVLDREAAESVQEALQEVELNRFMLTNLNDENAGLMEINEGLDASLASALREVDQHELTRLALVESLTITNELADARGVKNTLQEEQIANYKKRLIWGGVKDLAIEGGLAATAVAIGGRDGALVAAGIGAQRLIRIILR